MITRRALDGPITGPTSSFLLPWLLAPTSIITTTSSTSDSLVLNLSWRQYHLVVHYTPSSSSSVATDSQAPPQTSVGSATSCKCSCIGRFIHIPFCLIPTLSHFPIFPSGAGRLTKSS